MGKGLFFSQDIIEAWCDDDKVKFEDNVLSLGGDQSNSYRLTPAFRFKGISGDEEDAHHLLGEIKTEEELKGMGAEVYLNSCILGDIPYDVEPGYLANMGGKKGEKRSDEDLLTEFLLKNML